MFHVNSILQPSIATAAPVVGVAITTEVPVPGSATGATHLDDVESAVRFCIEVAKSFGAGQCRFHDQEEFPQAWPWWSSRGRRFHDQEEFHCLVSLYRDMSRLQTLGGRA